eukprot:6729181-Prymnesium_polylepis.1
MPGAEEIFDSWRCMGAGCDEDATSAQQQFRICIVCSAAKNIRWQTSRSVGHVRGRGWGAVLCELRVACRARQGCRNC